jgi:uncharacterized membrane protein
MRHVLGVIWRPVIRCFLAGVFAVLPLVITVGIVIWVASFVEQYLGPGTFVGARLRALGVQVAGQEADSTGILAYVVGWLVVLLVVFGLGILLELGARRLFQEMLENLVRKIPLIGSVYTTSKQVIDMLDQKRDDADLAGMRPVLCQFGGNQGAGVLALLASPQCFVVANQEYRIVIIPTAPVPFGGALLLIPTESVKPLDMSVEKLMNVYVSMGVTADQCLPTVAKP